MNKCTLFVNSKLVKQLSFHTLYLTQIQLDSYWTDIPLTDTDHKSAVVYDYFFCNVTRGELMKTYSYSCPVSIGATTYATRHLNLYLVIVNLPRLPSSRN